jgi:hypothetical protein
VENDDYYEFLSDIRNQKPQKPDDIQQKEREAEVAYKLLRNEHFGQHIKLQKLWFRIIIWTFPGAVVACLLWVVAIGMGWLDYTAYPYFLKWVVISIFGSLVGMAHVITKNLFPSRDS